jgi:hypothetical protein
MVTTMTVEAIQEIPSSNFLFQSGVNTSFSQLLPTLQVYIDASSLDLFKTCPRKYFFSIVLGRQPGEESVHLTFGTLLHSAVELYHKTRYVRDNERSHDDALRVVVKWLMIATWDKANNRPWTSNDRYKNRWTLIRTVVWYLDTHQEDILVTAILNNGQPAVELPFTFNTGYTAFTGEDFWMCGKMDRIAIYKPDSNFYITDVKTTKSTVSDYYFNKYSPDNQVSTYSIAGQVVFGINVEGLIIDAAQVAIEFSKFKRGLVERSTAQLQEWQQDLGYWLMNLSHCAETNNWPQNDSACDKYGGCTFRAVCSQKNPTAAMRVLEGSYRERIWDPLKNRYNF